MFPFCQSCWDRTANKTVNGITEIEVEWLKAKPICNRQYHPEHKLKNDFKWYICFSHLLSSPFQHNRSIQYYSKINLNFTSGSRFGNDFISFIEFSARASTPRSAVLFVSFIIVFVCLNSTQRIPHSHWIRCGADIGIMPYQI